MSMTTSQIIEYYANLLLAQYYGKVKAYSTVEALVKMVVMDQLPIAVQNAYSIDTAVGAQLDIIGKYVGANRNGYNFSGPVTLGDPDFRLLIKLAILRNYSGSSLADIQNLIAKFLPNTLYVYDYLDMRISYAIVSGSLSLAQFFIRQSALPKPMGVQLSALVYAPDVTHFFGFRTYTLPAYNNVGFNNYSNQYPGNWLSYSNGIFP